MHYVRADEWIAKIWAPKKKRDMPPTIDTGKANSKFRVDQISLILPDVRKKKLPHKVRQPDILWQTTNLRKRVGIQTR